MSINQPFLLLHSNDIHGHIDELTRIATLVRQLRAENSDMPVLYLDGGDSEESSVRLSNLTMHPSPASTTLFFSWRTTNNDFCEFRHVLIFVDEHEHQSYKEDKRA
jgi:hypothetical protein